MAEWSHYFHFPAGQDFNIDGPWGYNGRGRVLQNDASTLVVRMDIDAWGPAPALHATITMTYRHEGAGNTVIVHRDGAEPTQDNNATIISDDGRRMRRIDSGGITCRVQFDGDDEIDFDANINGEWWDFDFER